MTLPSINVQINSDDDDDAGKDGNKAFESVVVVAEVMAAAAAAAAVVDRSSTSDRSTVTLDLLLCLYAYRGRCSVAVVVVEEYHDKNNNDM